MGSLDEGVDIKRRIIEDLRPTVLDSMGLGAALDWYVESHLPARKLEMRALDQPADIQLPSAISIALFRVLQEALTNVLRHAKATNAWIKLDQGNDGLTLVIRDDGIGLPSATGSTEALARHSGHASAHHVAWGPVPDRQRARRVERRSGSSFHLLPSPALPLDQRPGPRLSDSNFMLLLGQPR